MTNSPLPLSGLNRGDEAGGADVVAVATAAGAADGAGGNTGLIGLWAEVLADEPDVEMAAPGWGGNVAVGWLAASLVGPTGPSASGAPLAVG